jgi:hypothetical protein
VPVSSNRISPSSPGWPDMRAIASSRSPCRPFGRGHVAGFHRKAQRHPGRDHPILPSRIPFKTSHCSRRWARRLSGRLCRWRRGERGGRSTAKERHALSEQSGRIAHADTVERRRATLVGLRRPARNRWPPLLGSAMHRRLGQSKGTSYRAARLRPQPWQGFR